MALTPFDEGRDGQTEENWDTSSFLLVGSGFRADLPGSRTGRASIAVSAGTFPRSCTRLNQNLPFCLFVCLSAKTLSNPPVDFLQTVGVRLFVNWCCSP